MAEPLVLVEHGRRLELSAPSDPYGDGYVHYVDVTLIDEGLSAKGGGTVEGRDGLSLSEYFTELAQAWRGWAGMRSWEAMEHGLLLEATHDGSGHVSLAVTVRGPRWYLPDAWLARVVFALEAGEELTCLARDVAAFIGPAG
jgi:hypothetical protein